jgi:anti-sigma regulatory factor (Ser/Thr protein kinase)
VLPASDGLADPSVVPIETRTFGVNPADARNIDDWVASVGGRWKVGARALFATRLCIAELFNNVIEHGTARKDDDHVVLTLKRQGTGIVVEFMDTRGQFDPTNITGRSERLTKSVGGHGMLLVRAYSRELEYHYDGQYNHTTLKIS